MNTRAITLIKLENPMTYPDYRALMEKLVNEEKTTGPEQSEQRVGYTKLNLQRMKRVEKQFSLMTDLGAMLVQQRPNWHWLVLVESWCGDGAQLVPAIAHIAAAIPGIELTILLRDENPLLMDTCLTNGSRSIPMLICKDRTTQKRLFTWGPRPVAIQEKLVAYKVANPDADYEAAAVQLHGWYAKDRSQALQQDLLKLAGQVYNNASQGVTEALF
jgi:hypothetical protein